MSSFPRDCEAMLRRSPNDDAEVHNGAGRISLCGSMLALMSTIRGNPLASSCVAATKLVLRLDFSAGGTVFRPAVIRSEERRVGKECPV